MPPHDAVAVVGALTLISLVNPWFLSMLPFLGIVYSATYI